jgi:hypothetical protein
MTVLADAVLIPVFAYAAAGLLRLTIHRCRKGSST